MVECSLISYPWSFDQLVWAVDNISLHVVGGDKLV